MNKNRKGFTIVELVIVIAIIAILAAVLIPTFASLIAKANVSVDTQLVRNLNNALAQEKAGGENIKTMDDALKMTKSAGYDIDTIVSKSGNNIAWDSKNDRFVLIDPNNNTYIYPTENGAGSQTIANPVDFFVIYNEVPAVESQKYSVYLSKNATVAGPITVKVVFDAGENTAVSTVKYSSDSAQTVIIRTNGGSLTVSAPNGVVDRYGYCDLLDVQAVKSTSLHEYGTSSMVSINSGRVVFEKENSTGVVFVESNEAIVAVAKDVEIPEVKRAAEVTSFKIQTVETNEGTVKTTTETVVTISGGTVTTETKDASDQTVEAPANIKVDTVKESAKVEQSKDTVKNENVAFDVKDETNFNNALSSGNKIIRLQNNLVFNSVVLIGRDITIDGNGHNIYGSANRVIRVTAPNLTVNFKNLGIISTCTATSDVRGVSFDNNTSGCKVVFDNCKISASFYAINIVTGPENLDITIKNGTVAAGWAAINSYSNNSKFTLENTVLSGINDKGESSWNDFATIVFDGYGRDNVNNVDKYGSGNTLNIVGSTIFASSNSSNKQAWLAIQYGAKDNTITVDGSTRITDGITDQVENITLIPFVGYVSSAERYSASYDTNSKLNVNGEEILLNYDGSLDFEAVISQ